MDAVGGGMSAAAGAPLSAQIRKQRRSDRRASFVLDVALRFAPGFTILFGPSGAGKSTVLDCVAGLLRPDAGRIAIGDDVVFDGERRIDAAPQHRRVAYVFQSLALFPHLSVEENVAYGLAQLTVAEQRAKASGILKAFRVEHLGLHRPGEISGGERQRVALARSLVTEPRVLLLDEPLSGLDAELKASIVGDLREWNAARNIPVLYVTHSRDEVDALGERVIALENGRVVSEGTPRSVLDAPRSMTLAQSTGFENVLNGEVRGLREDEGVMLVRAGQLELEVPLGYARAGDAVRVAVRAGDILLAAEKPHGLSARNVVGGTIVSLEERGAVVNARVDCGATLLVQVTRGAMRELKLAVGGAVWVVVKTHSCHVLEQ